eukprot:GHVT01017518.1.p1 GENE.GHVT01017518.1~~GHVT01017518.1.p1  ORF type:complete len:100 (-),score=9.76 GHVT01017518.1:345-644(-)
MAIAGVMQRRDFAAKLPTMNAPCPPWNCKCNLNPHCAKQLTRPVAAIGRLLSHLVLLGPLAMAVIRNTHLINREACVLDATDATNVAMFFGAHTVASTV